MAGGDVSKFSMWPSTIGTAMDDGDHKLISAHLSWKDLTVQVNRSKTVLHGVSGFAEPGRLVAIMGPSGSGKSTLIDALAGSLPTFFFEERLSKNTTLAGEILINGHKTQLSYGTAAYLAQEVLLLGTLTVYETLIYSAKLRFPNTINDAETRAIVEFTIAQVGLTGSIHTPIGCWYRRGVSGGEKRRVSIGIELLTSPRLLLLDEPTSGLDSASAFHVLNTLKTLARDHRTILCSIHQPSSEVFSIFDDLCLLSGGQQVYFGELKGALLFFANSGFPCPPLRNPSDHYLLCINSDFDDVRDILKESESTSDGQLLENDSEQATAPKNAFTTAEAVKHLTHSFATSQEKKDIDDHIQTMRDQGGDVPNYKGSHAGFLRQSYFLTRRSMLNMCRDLGYYWLRLIMYTFLCLTIGTIYFKTGHEFRAIQARAACLSFVVAFFTFMSVGGSHSFVEDIKVFKVERLNGHYELSAFVVGNTLSCIPFIFLISLVSSSLVYFLVDLHPGGLHFIYFVLSLFGSLLVAESLMMAICSLIPNYLIGSIIGCGIQGMLVLVSGFYRLPHDLPGPVWRYPTYYFAWLSYAFSGMLQNEFYGETFENINPSDPPLQGAYIVRDLYQVQNRSKWWNLAILFLMFVGYRVIFYLCLIAGETVVPRLRAYASTKVAKKTSVASQ